MRHVINCLLTPSEDDQGSLNCSVPEHGHAGHTIDAGNVKRQRGLQKRQEAIAQRLDTLEGSCRAEEPSTDCFAWQKMDLKLQVRHCWHT